MLTEIGYGYYAGIVTTLILLLLILLLYYLLFKRVSYCRGVLSRTPHGSLMISAHAISDLIRSLEDEFDSLEIGKIYLIRGKKGETLEIHVNYQPSSDSRPLHELAEQLQLKSKNILAESFGITTVTDVSIKVGRAKPFKHTF